MKLFKNYLLICIKFIFDKEMCSMMYFIDGYIDVRFVVLKAGAVACKM